MKPALETNDREFLEQLHRLGAVTIQDICDAIGVTATAVRQRLVRLQGAGLVTREIMRAGRGRPRHVYKVTPAGQRELGDNYSDLALTLWRGIQEIEQPEIRATLIERVREALVSHYGGVANGASLDKRLHQLGSALRARGFDVEIDTTKSLPILREHACPYLELASSDADICRLEQEVFQAILQTDVVLKQRCVDGHTCCEFHASRGSIESQPVADRVS